MYVTTAQFVSDLVGNPEDMFSHDVAYLGVSICIAYSLFLTKS